MSLLSPSHAPNAFLPEVEVGRYVYSTMKNVRREKHGWRATIQSGGRSSTLSFGDGQYHNARQALDAAHRHIVQRDERPPYDLIELKQQQYQTMELRRYEAIAEGKSSLRFELRIHACKPSWQRRWMSEPLALSAHLTQQIIKAAIARLHGRWLAYERNRLFMGENRALDYDYEQAPPAPCGDFQTSVLVKDIRKWTGKARGMTFHEGPPIPESRHPEKQAAAEASRSKGVSVSRRGSSRRQRVKRESLVPAQAVVGLGGTPAATVAPSHRPVQTVESVVLTPDVVDPFPWPASYIEDDASTERFAHLETEFMPPRLPLCPTLPEPWSVAYPMYFCFLAARMSRTRAVGLYEILYEHWEKAAPGELIKGFAVMEDDDDAFAFIGAATLVGDQYRFASAAWVRIDRGVMGFHVINPPRNLCLADLRDHLDEMLEMPRG